ncbi:alpha-L-rhamnosidase C-terminal domain-containing protein [Paenibacillus thermotolerans]|uniref:alpha-L-rhamnosidase C-terminal domain-containing protein n=1 Tax=Paenibacillus thermotolerans TaxID=3027807 RepID=UPI00236748A5|nr:MULTISPECIES: alpha-L-rhamnosidase C-terminal domain-containing protein [unclassified Paenibacillus]
MRTHTQTLETGKLPAWIWHPKREQRKSIRLSKRFVVERDAERPELSVACTGSVRFELDGVAIGGIEDHPRHATLFTKIPGMPESLSEGSHTIAAVIECSEPMPVGPINIHLFDRTVGFIAYLQADGVWLPTDETWDAEEEKAAVVCRLGDEPYGDLDNGPEWFVRGGYGDIAVSPIANAAVLSASGTEVQASGGMLVLEGTAVKPLQFTPERNEKHVFYHLLKQNEWKAYRTWQKQNDLRAVPQTVVDLRREDNVRFKVRNKGHTDVSLLWSGAESLYELEHYDSCITELIAVPAGKTAVTLPQGYRYLQLFVGGESDAPFRLELEFEAAGVPLAQIGTVETDLPLLDRIYDVAVHTNKVCHQIGLWDGIKRDRLNWAYDFYMAAKADFVLWNDFTVLKRAMSELGKTPYGYWMNSIPSYTLWWIIGLWEYYLHTGDKPFIVATKNDFVTHLRWVRENSDRQTGWLTNPHQAFIEWVPMKQEESWAALNAILKLMNESVRLLDRYVPELELGELADWPDPEIEESVFLQEGNAFITPLIGIVSGLLPERSAERFLSGCELRDPITPLSAFWLAECYSKYGFHDKAWNVISTVWGSMLEQGATTFWESSVLMHGSDFHQAQTTYTAYDSYRMSLCHSWASTPVQWISRYVLGVKPLEPGYESFSFEPVPLPGMSRCSGIVNTPRGPLHIQWKAEEGELNKKVFFAPL